MTTPRRAQSDERRTWDHDVAEANERNGVRAWVVWGEGPPPERAAEREAAEARPGEPGNDIARHIADGVDPEWGERDDGWVVIAEADEDEIDRWVVDDDAVRGYAPYLMAREDAAAEPSIQRGLLRSDVVRRRKPKRFDAARPS